MSLANNARKVCDTGLDSEHVAEHLDFPNSKCWIEYSIHTTLLHSFGGFFINYTLEAALGQKYMSSWELLFSWHLTHSLCIFSSVWLTAVSCSAFSRLMSWGSMVYDKGLLKRRMTCNTKKFIVPSATDKAATFRICPYPSLWLRGFTPTPFIATVYVGALDQSPPPLWHGILVGSAALYPGFSSYSPYPAWRKQQNSMGWE